MRRGGSVSAVPADVRKRMGELRAEFAARTVDRAPAAWCRLELSTRTVLLLLAGIDAAGDADLSTLALRDWREFAPPEQTAIKQAADALRWQLNGAADLARI